MKLSVNMVSNTAYLNQRSLGSLKYIYLVRYPIYVTAHQGLVCDAASENGLD